MLDDGVGPVLLLSAGIGVTPVLARLHEAAESGSTRPCAGCTPPATLRRRSSLTRRIGPPMFAALADSLGIERFGVVGFSFGGPYARACGNALPEGVTRAGLVSCLGPIDDPAATRGMPPPTRYGLAAARLSPVLARPMVWATAHQTRRGKMVDQLAKSMSPPDAEVLHRPGVAHSLGRSLAESFRQGSEQ